MVEEALGGYEIHTPDTSAKVDAKLWGKHQDIDGVSMARECFIQIRNDYRDKDNPDNIEQLVECGLAALQAPRTDTSAKVDVENNRGAVCPFCDNDPFHYVDNGVGMEAVAVTCCDLGDQYFRGMRPIPEEVILSWDDFTNIADKLNALQAPRSDTSAAELVVGQYYMVCVLNDPDSVHAWEQEYMPARYDGSGRWNYLAAESVEWEPSCIGRKL
jgi:hypothetical protein